MELVEIVVDELTSKGKRKAFHLMKDRLETKMYMIDLCSELIEIYNNEQDETSYQKLLNNDTEEKIQTLCYYLQNNISSDNENLHKYNTKVIQLFEKVETPEYERLKRLVLVKGPELLKDEGVFSKFLEYQFDEIKDISLLGKEFKTNNLQLSDSYCAYVDEFEKSFGIEQEIYDLNEELNNVSTLEVAKSLIDRVLVTMRHHINEYYRNNSIGEDNFWLSWLNCSKEVLTEEKEETVFKLRRPSTFHDWFKKALRLLPYYLMNIFICYMIYLMIDYPRFHYYGSCEYSESNLKSIKKHGLVPQHIFRNKIIVYGDIGFFSFFQLFVVLQFYVLLALYMLNINVLDAFYRGEKDIGQIAKLTSLDLILKELFWNATIRLFFPGWMVVYYIIHYGNMWYQKRVLAEACP